jgi:hypothetical protein
MIIKKNNQTIISRPVHGSVRFGFNNKNQPNQVTHIF